MDAATTNMILTGQTSADDDGHLRRYERARARRYPVSRWYLRPAAALLARILAPTFVRPSHLTICGLVCALAAMAWLAAIGFGVVLPLPVAGGLVLLWWLFDRTDGLLARRQGTASARGAWLDANVDELVDMGVHAAIAFALAARTGADWPYLLLAAFVIGKYLLMYGLQTEEHPRRERVATIGESAEVRSTRPSPLRSIARTLWHAPGNADIRAHAMAILLATNCLTAALVLVAAYYNIRWAVRWVLVWRRLGQQ